MNKITDLLIDIFPKLSAGYITVLATLIYLTLTALYYVLLGVCVYTGIRFAVILWA